MDKFLQRHQLMFDQLGLEIIKKIKQCQKYKNYD